MSRRFRDTSLYEALEALKEKRQRLERANKRDGEYRRVVLAYNELLTLYRKLNKVTEGERQRIYLTEVVN